MKANSPKVNLIYLSIIQLFGLSLFFAPNASIDQLVNLLSLSDIQIAWISIAVTLGFVCGGLIFALFNIADSFKGENILATSCYIGGLLNLLLVLVNAHSFVVVFILRFLTGICVAGIYPIGMKLVASHFKTNRGFAIAVLLAALNLGSGLPYLFRLFGSPSWKIVTSLAAGCAIIGGVLTNLFISQGEYIASSQKISLNALKKIIKNPSVKLANYGYDGHMWELYAMWVWVPIFLKLSYENANPNASEKEVIFFFASAAFGVFVTGAIADILGGWISDRIGRTAFNIIMLTTSGMCGLIIGLFYSNPFISLVIALIWGATVIPDSPQYSAMISELADPEVVGTALTIQTAIGFGLSILSIRLIPTLADKVGWRYAFSFLSIGPFVGIIALLKLRSLPESTKIAMGKK